MRVTYRIDLRPKLGPPSLTVKQLVPEWKPQTRVKTKREAEAMKDTWEARGFEVRIVPER